MSDKEEEKQRVALAQTIQAIKNNWPAERELIQLQARRTHEKFIALQSVGFSIPQALDLCVRLV